MTQRAATCAQRLPLAGLALLLCVTTLACDGPMDVAEPGIVGTWTLDQSALQLGETGTVNVSLSGTAGLDDPVVTGAYATTESTISLSDTSGIQACDPALVGRYTFVVDATSLSLEVLTDGCLQQ